MTTNTNIKHKEPSAKEAPIGTYGEQYCQGVGCTYRNYL